MSNADPSALLEILTAQGKKFLDRFEIVDSPSKKRKREERAEKERTRSHKISRSDAELRVDQNNHESEEEWSGFGRLQPYEGSIDSGEENENSKEDFDSGFEQEDDDFTAETLANAQNVFVFSDPIRKSNDFVPLSKTQKKAFMSSKISKLNEHVENGLGVREKESMNEDDEHTNAQNDAILHKLVHTKLLSGSLNSELDMTPAQRKKALAGRVLEITGSVKLGKGENAVRETERNKAARHVREGLMDKKKQREKQELEEAKNLGNYHPTLKKLFGNSSTPPGGLKKRDRGLKMGVGRFSGGMLKLSREDISAAEGSSFRGRGRGRGSRGGNTGRSASRGGGRGLPRGRGRT